MTELRDHLDRLDTALAAARPTPRLDWSYQDQMAFEQARYDVIKATPGLLAAVRAAADLADELEVPVEGLTGPDGPMVPFYNGRDVAFRIRRTLAAALPALTDGATR